MKATDIVAKVGAGAAEDNGHLPAGDGHEPLERGDLLIADRFVAEYGRDFRYVPGLDWHAWDPPCWRVCELGEHVEAGKTVARQMIADPGVDAASAKASMQEPRVRGALRLAASDPALAVRAAGLDADPYVVATPAGVVELRTGALRAGRREDLLTRLTAVAPAETVAPGWRAFLERVQPDPLVRGFLQRLVGMALVGAVREHVLPVFYGEGANGKGVFVGTLGRVFGDYAHVASLGLLMQGGKPGSATPEIADLRGRRWVEVSESPEDGRLAVEKVKWITGGDMLTGRRLHSNLITFRPSHTIVLVTNHRPRVPDDGVAIWRRLLLVPWAIVIPEAERERDLGERLVREEGPAILRWALDGARLYLRDGLGVPECIRSATVDYRSREDWFGTWLAERTVESSAAMVRAGELLADYREWGAVSGGPYLTDAAMRERLEARGYERDVRRGRVSWIGIRLREGGSE